MTPKSSLILAIGLVGGLIALGILGGKAALDYRAMERTVVVKGLAENEYPADVVIWPIPYQVVSNDIETLYRELDRNQQRIITFLRSVKIPNNEITNTIPKVVDKYANDYGNAKDIPFRFSATQSVTVYSKNIDLIHTAMGQLDSLGKEGVPLSVNDYEHSTQYLFSNLNEVKPNMIEEATANAREVAQKFAEDSNSRLGKIRSAHQGQFSISDRDSNNPHIKKVRVVTTVEYYLAD